MHSQPQMFTDSVFYLLTIEFWNNWRRQELPRSSMVYRNLYQIPAVYQCNIDLNYTRKNKYNVGKYLRLTVLWNKVFDIWCLLCERRNISTQVSVTLNISFYLLLLFHIVCDFLYLIRGSHALGITVLWFSIFHNVDCI